MFLYSGILRCTIAITAAMALSESERKAVNDSMVGGRASQSTVRVAGTRVLKET